MKEKGVPPLIAEKWTLETLTVGNIYCLLQSTWAFLKLVKYLLQQGCCSLDYLAAVSGCDEFLLFFRHLCCCFYGTSERTGARDYIVMIGSRNKYKFTSEIHVIDAFIIDNNCISYLMVLATSAYFAMAVFTRPKSMWARPSRRRSKAMPVTSYHSWGPQSQIASTSPINKKQNEIQTN